MSVNESTQLPYSPSSANAIANIQASTLEASDAVWASGVTIVPPAHQPLQNIAVYLHALRRRWLIATGLALICAAMIAPAVWLGLGARYTSKSYLRVSSREQMLVFKTAERHGYGTNQFGIYKGTQQQLVKSRFVLTAALRKDEVRRLDMVKRENDPIAWLSRKLRITFPGKAEIMEVSLRGDDPRETTVLVRAVVAAYLKEVVNVEHHQRRERLSKLDRVYTEKETEVRNRRTDFKQLAEQLGTGDTKALSLKQEIALQQFGSYRNELVRHQLDLRQSYGELKAKQALLETIDEDEISEFEIDVYVRTDPIAQQMLAELAWRRSDMNYNIMMAVPGTNSAYTERAQRELQLAQQQFDMRTEELLEELRQKKRAEFAFDIKQLEMNIAIGEEQVLMLQEDVDRQRKEAERIGESSIDVEMMRAELDHLDQVLNGIANEREMLKVELRSTSRITLLQRAEAPESPDRTGRLALTIFSAIVGLCVPVGIVAWWDSRAGRINSTTDVSKGLGLPVIGSVPVIPVRAIRQLGSPSKSHLNWHTRLTESADSIAARLLRKAELEQTRVVLVTSAMGGEGKTTLATQLAMSLARSERSAILVDFDLRRPAFDEVFGLPLKPGVSEFLRGECSIDDVIQHTATNDLAVVTAGRWDRHALTALANGTAGTLFDKLRDEYDFILVDASPILPVADTRFVSQHVDAVILSVLRDVSQAPKITASCDILRAFGVRILEAVVTGPSEGGRYKDLGYEPRLPA